MDHPAGTEVGREIQFARAGALRVVVERGVGVRADMGRECQRADVDRAPRPERGRPLLLIRRVAREHRGAGLDGWGDVPELFHASGS